jgi:hypothetical protein
LVFDFETTGAEMKSLQLSFFVILASLLLFKAPDVYARQDDETSQDNIRPIAELFPPVDMFVMLENDPLYLDWLDRIIWEITSELPDEIAPVMTLRNLINQSIAPNLGFDLITVITSMIGDNVAVGIDQVGIMLSQESMSLSPLIIYIAAPINNRSLIENMLPLTGLLDGSEHGTQGKYTTYTMFTADTILAISDEYLFMVIGSTTLPLDIVETLADEPNFMAALDALPLPDYGALFYGRTGEVARSFVADPSIEEILAAVGLDINDLGALAAGLTVIEEQAVIFDVVQVRLPKLTGQETSIKPHFSSYIPGDNTIFVHSTNIDTLLNTTSGLIASISASDSALSVYGQIENLIRIILGLDWATEILPWAGGDYGIFATFDTIDDTSALPVQIGVVLEISDPMNAQTLIIAVADAAERLIEDTVVVETQILAEDGTLQDVIIFEYDDEAIGTIELVLGHSDTFLFLATHAMAIDLLDGGTTLNTTEHYQVAQQYALADNEIFAFVDGETLAELLAATISIIDLQQPDTDESTQALMTTIPEIIPQVIDSSAISVTSTIDGNLILRMVVILATLE